MNHFTENGGIIMFMDFLLVVMLLVFYYGYILHYILKVGMSLNIRPRKALDWFTPPDKFAQLIVYHHTFKTVAPQVWIRPLGTGMTGTLRTRIGGTLKNTHFNLISPWVYSKNESINP